MTVRVLRGDCREVLRALPDRSVHCVVTSPPYWGLRDYGVAGQIGLELNYREYVAEMVEIFRELRRVLRDDGTVWLNLGDSYANDGKWGGQTGGKQAYLDDASRKRNGREKRVTGLKPKDLIGIPWRVAFALQDDGWWLRQSNIWAKRNSMPESVRDRTTTAHEYVFHLSKSDQYFYDATAIEEKGEIPAGTRAAKGSNVRSGLKDVNGRPPKYWEYTGTRNKRSVWWIATRPFADAHFATMPPELAEVCILAGTSERGCCANCGAAWVRQEEKRFRPQTDVSLDKGVVPSWSGRQGAQNWAGTPRGTTRRDTVGWLLSCQCKVLSGTRAERGEVGTVPCVVLDPFAGAGTTGLVADRLGRDAILIELNPDYADMIERRIFKDAGLFADVAE